MHKNTKNLLDDILQYEEIPKRLSLLKDAYKGEECFIISAGPSFFTILAISIFSVAT